MGAGMHQVHGGFGAVAVDAGGGSRSEQRILLDQGVRLRRGRLLRTRDGGGSQTRQHEPLAHR
jgi:hypothetical protein